jgi:putative ABC transport system permease protein
MSTIASIRFSDLLPLAWGSLRRNRLRSVLTVGAIAVGIAVMLYLISLGDGLQTLTVDSVKNSTSLLTLTVKTASTELFPMTTQNIAKIPALPGVKQVLPRLTLKAKTSLNDVFLPTTVVGVDPDYLQVQDDSKLLAGRYYRADDTQLMVVTTGFLAAYGLVDTAKVPLVIFTIQLDKTEYPGVTDITNVGITGVIQSDSQAVYVPRTWMESVLGKNTPPYDDAHVTVNDISSIDSARNALIANGFQVTAAVDTVDSINKIFFYIQAVLAGLGLIAIFVATIGMFNTLTISLLERTKEIGIMKALGVRNRDIKRLFLYEAAMIGILGGIIGILICLVLQQLTVFVLSLLAAIANGVVPTIFNNPLILIGGALVFALFISVLTGIYPAVRATRLKTIDAIRHE